LSSCKSWLSTFSIEVKLIFEISFEVIRFKCELIIIQSSTSSSVLMNDMTFYDCKNSDADDAHWIFTILRVIISDWSFEDDVELVCVWVKDVLIFSTRLCLKCLLLKSNCWTIMIKLLIIWFASKSLNISELTLYRNDVNFFSMIVDFLWNLMCLSVDACFLSHCSAWFVKFFSWYLLMFKILRISVMFLKVEHSSSSWEFWYLIVIFFLRHELVIMMSQ